MKQPLLIPLLLSVGLNFLFQYTQDKKDEKIQYLQFQNNILHDYKRVYLEHLEKCDTIHQRCFNTNISSIKIFPVHTITSCNSQTVFCSSCGNNTISTNIGGMLTKADAG